MDWRGLSPRGPQELFGLEGARLRLGAFDLLPSESCSVQPLFCKVGGCLASIRPGAMCSAGLLQHAGRHLVQQEEDLVLEK